mgnify:CR=1 FL=1
MKQFFKKISKIFTRSIDNQLNYKEVLDMITKSQNVMLIDVRSIQEYEEGHLDGAICIPLYELQDKITDKGCNGAPDWIIEIISPGNKEMDYFKKLFKYQAAGVREYWIVDPIKEIVMVYRFEKETMEEYSFGEDVPVGIYDGFSIKVQ